MTPPHCAKSSDLSDLRVKVCILSCENLEQPYIFNIALGCHILVRYMILWGNCSCQNCWNPFPVMQSIKSQVPERWRCGGLGSNRRKYSPGISISNRPPTNQRTACEKRPPGKHEGRAGWEMGRSERRRASWVGMAVPPSLPSFLL